MSLLMQALKKAEHAKQKQGNAPAADAAEDKNPPKNPNEEISLSPKEFDSTAAAESNLDLTGLELSPMSSMTSSTKVEPALEVQEFAAEFPAPSREIPESSPSRDTYAENTRLENENRSNAEAVSLQLAAKNRLEQQKAAALEEGKRQAEQQKAKAVFASKQPNSNRRALLIALAGLIIVALFMGGGYYYLQLGTQNSSTLMKSLPINTPAGTLLPPAAAPGTDAVSATAESTSAATPVQAQNQDAQTAPFKPGKTPAAPAKAETQNEQARTNVALDARPIEIHQTTVDSHINPALSNAYLFYVTGDMGSAQQQYQTVLQQEPNNRDALLGMAAVAINRKQNGQAGSFYTRLLELDPADPDAIAGLTSLQGGDPSQSESRLKKVLTLNPEAGAVLFALGNLYSQQSRWSDAQQAYFRAFGTAPGNADYAVNLAVSLDRLGQEKLALEYYQRALALAQSRPGNFNKVTIQNRVKELQSVEGSK